MSVVQARIESCLPAKSCSIVYLLCASSDDHKRQIHSSKLSIFCQVTSQFVISFSAFYSSHKPAPPTRHVSVVCAKTIFSTLHDEILEFRETLEMTKEEESLLFLELTTCANIVTLNYSALIHIPALFLFNLVIQKDKLMLVISCDSFFLSRH